MILERREDEVSSTLIGFLNEGIFQTVSQENRTQSESAVSLGGENKNQSSALHNQLGLEDQRTKEKTNTRRPKI